MRANGVRIATAIAHQTTICESKSKHMSRSMRKCSAKKQAEPTRACHIRIRTSIGVASFASANDGIAAGIVRTDGIRITSTVVHLASIYEECSMLGKRVNSSQMIYLCKPQRHQHLC